MASNVEVPGLGESITQAVINRWIKADGQVVSKDEPICELETDKANVDMPASSSGVLRHVRAQGDTVAVGEVIGRIEESSAAAASAPAAAAPVVAAKAPLAVPSPAKLSLADLSPSVRRLVEENHLDPAAIRPTGPGNRITKEDVQKYLASHPIGQGNGASAAAATPAPSTLPPSTAKAAAPSGVASAEPADFDARGEKRVPMSKIRQAIAATLLRAQQTAAILTTFNEVDMTAILDLRSRYKERFTEVHGVGLGFMSFFARAVVLGLKEFPLLNAYLDGSAIVYHQHINLGVAVSTDRGLAVPVLRKMEDLSFAQIETEIKRLATATRDGKLGVDEVSGGTFTITNGGIFGSLLSTPIINPPQSGILGMHAIQKRPVAINDKVEIRPMMYLALSYDHRLVDGKEAIGFLVRLKQCLEDPTRLMLGV